MDPLALEKPFLDGGIRTVNFFNGRLLTAKDLSREQEARRLADGRLGRAIGEGVAYGLEVLKHSEATAQDPLVTVKPGLAINRVGQTLCLTEDTTVALVRKSKLAAAADTTFAQCGPLQGGTYVAGPGVYLLTIAPAAAREGKALTSGLELEGGRCNTDTMVETVQFRLLPMDLTAFGLTSPVAQPKEESLFRNRLAARCLGTKSLDRSDPFAESGAAPISELAGKALSKCDVPLALLYWTLSGGLRFIDNWAVRRRVTASATTKDWSFLVNDRRRAEAEAMFLQFQDQIAGLASPSGDLGAVTARSHFRYLPPVGVIPVAEETDASDAQATKFFKDMTYRGPAFINAARLEGLLRESLCYPPVDTQSGEMVWLYRVRENRRESDFTGSAPEPRSYLVFASGHLPYRADAQFDLAYWNYSNYPLAR